MEEFYITLGLSILFLFGMVGYLYWDVATEDKRKHR